jgi:hypothetical protein
MRMSLKERLYPKPLLDGRIQLLSVETASPTIAPIAVAETASDFLAEGFEAGVRGVQQSFMVLCPDYAAETVRRTLAHEHPYVITLVADEMSRAIDYTIWRSIRVDLPSP